MIIKVKSVKDALASVRIPQDLKVGYVRITQFNEPDRAAELARRSTSWKRTECRRSSSICATIRWLLSSAVDVSGLFLRQEPRSFPPKAACRAANIGPTTRGARRDLSRGPPCQLRQRQRSEVVAGASRI